MCPRRPAAPCAVGRAGASFAWVRTPLGMRAGRACCPAATTPACRRTLRPDPDRLRPIFILLRPPAAGMEYVYAALLLHKLDKDVTEESISSVVQASGAEVNQAQVKSLVAALGDVDIDEAVKAAPMAVAAAAAPAADPAAEKSGDAAEEKKEEKDDSQSEEQAMAGLSSLFG